MCIPLSTLRLWRGGRWNARGDRGHRETSIYGYESDTGPLLKRSVEPHRGGECFAAGNHYWRRPQPRNMMDLDHVRSPLIHDQIPAGAQAIPALLERRDARVAAADL